MKILIEILQGTASILIVLIPLLIPQVREFIIKRYQLSLDKALEDKKASNERKNYVSKVRFDKEFTIFQELSEKTFNLATCVQQISYSKYFHENEINRTIYINLIICFDRLENFLFKNITFMDKKLADKYADFHELALEIIVDYRNEDKNLYKVETYSDYMKRCNEEVELRPIKINLKDIIHTEEIQRLIDLHEEIIDEVRIYLQSLEIRE